MKKAPKKKLTLNKICIATLSRNARQDPPTLTERPTEVNTCGVCPTVWELGAR